MSQLETRVGPQVGLVRVNQVSESGPVVSRSIRRATPLILNAVGQVTAGVTPPQSPFVPLR